MSVTRIMHVTKQGHRCTHPYDRSLNTMLRTKQAAAIGNGKWRLEYYRDIKAYGVHPVNKANPFYEFTNFNCAAAKLHELGKPDAQERDEWLMR